MPSRLHISDHPGATWAEVAEPWLRKQGTNWRESRIVLAPNAAWLAALKSEAVMASLPAMGIQWLTPGRWRTLALRSLSGPPGRIALREDLHLLIELAAARLPDNLIARSYGQDAAPFQEVLDALDAAGWTTEALPDPAARELAQLAAQLRAQAGWMTSAEADRRLHEAAANGRLPILGHHLLAVGFGPADWALRALLEAACATCSNTVLVLDVPREEKSAVTAAWVGAWEQCLMVEAQRLEPPGAPGPFAPLRDRLEFSSPTRPAPPLDKPPLLLLADDLQAEADLAVGQALRFLAASAGEDMPRVGLACGAVSSPLAREIAARLASLGLPHHNIPGHLPGRTPPQALFEAWLDWQESGRLAGLVEWARAAQTHSLLDAKAGKQIEESLRCALGATLVDDPAVLAAWIEADVGAHAAAREFLEAWPRLPDPAPWEDCVAAIAVVAEKLGWPAPPEIFADRAATLANAFAEPLPRAAVLRWTRAVTRIPGRTRDALGREPFAPIQIVDAASAPAQRWTHLVLGGLQHGEWPAGGGDSPLLDAARIAELNRQVLHEGAHGEGHLTVAPGRALLLSQDDRRQLERAAFARLASLPTAGLALSSRMHDPADGRPARLSEFFWATARAVLGQLPEAVDWDALAASSRKMRVESQKFFAHHSVLSESGDDQRVPDAAQTQRAFAARRDPGAPFDEYSFCLKQPPAEPLRLSCKAWENAVKNPGATWFTKVLRVEPHWDPATDDCTRLSIGNWAHTWVRPGPPTPGDGAPPASFPLLSGGLWQKFADDSADEFHRRAVAAFARAGRSPPEFWIEAWAEAARAASLWIDALADTSGWPHALAEVNLPPGLLAELPGGAGRLPLSGRVDLALFSGPVNFKVGGLAGREAQVIDFKTGGDKPITLKKLARGDGLQLALYGLSLQALGAGGISLTVLNQQADAGPQLSGEDLREEILGGLWALLTDFAHKGRWGARPGGDDDYSPVAPMPGATLSVPTEILRLKWRLTHPDSA